MQTSNVVEIYQCPGCINGYDINCGKFENYHENLACKAHAPGTISQTGSNFITFFLGMPKGFNRIGPYKNLKIQIFENITHLNETWNYDKYNVPVWKYLNKKGHIFVRGLSPRINYPFLHIILSGMINEIHCLELFDKDLEQMD